MVKRRYRHYPSDQRQGSLFPIRQSDEIGRSLERILAAAPSTLATDYTSEGTTITHPINDLPGYGINPKTTVPFFSKIKRFGGSREISHEDHFKLAREVYDGVYAAESHKHNVFTGQYGVPHELLIHMAPSEIIAVYNAIGRIKSGRSAYATAGKRYDGLIREKPFIGLISRMVEGGRHDYNALSIMHRKENREKSVPPLTDRLSVVSKEAKEEFYTMLSEPLVPARHPYRAAPATGDVNSFYRNGIDTYLGSLFGLLAELYRMKAPRKVQQQSAT